MYNQSFKIDFNLILIRFRVAHDFFAIKNCEWVFLHIFSNMCDFQENALDILKSIEIVAFYLAAVSYEAKKELQEQKTLHYQQKILLIKFVNLQHLKAMQ